MYCLKRYRINYSRGQLFKLRFKSPVSSELYLSLRANGILYTRRTRAGRSVKSRSSSIPVLTAFRRSDCSIRYKHCHRFADHKNLVSIQRCSSTRMIAAGTCLKFCTWNARSIRNKSASFLDYICENNIDLITVTETWLSESDAAVRAECTPIGYKLTDCPLVGRCGGGTALIYRSSLSVTEVISGTKPSFEFAEYIVSDKNSTIRLVIVYRPPYSDAHPVTICSFLDDFADYLESIILTTEPLLVAGDFNIHVDIPDNSDSVNFIDLLDSMAVSTTCEIPHASTWPHTRSINNTGTWFTSAGLAEIGLLSLRSLYGAVWSQSVQATPHC